MVDLTTLEGADTPGKVRGPVREGAPARSGRPRRSRRSPPSAYTPTWSAVARERAGRQPGRGRLGGDRVPVRARVARGEAGRRRRGGERPAPTRWTWSSTAGRSWPAGTAQVYEEIARGPRGVRARAPQGDPGDRRAGHPRQRAPAPPGWSMLAGADFIKTSTGKLSASGDAAGCPGHAVGRAGFRGGYRPPGRRQGRRRGQDGQGCRSATWSWCGRPPAPDWLTPATASASAPASLVNDLLMQRRKQLTGAYSGPRLLHPGLNGYGGLGQERRHAVPFQCSTRVVSASLVQEHPIGPGVARAAWSTACSPAPAPVRRHRHPRPRTARTSGDPGREPVRKIEAQEKRINRSRADQGMASGPERLPVFSGSMILKVCPGRIQVVVATVVIVGGRCDEGRASAVAAGGAGGVLGGGPGWVLGGGGEAGGGGQPRHAVPVAGAGGGCEVERAAAGERAVFVGGGAGGDRGRAGGG